MCEVKDMQDAELLALFSLIVKEIQKRFLSKISTIAELKNFVKGQSD